MAAMPMADQAPERSGLRTQTQTRPSIRYSVNQEGMSSAIPATYGATARHSPGVSQAKLSHINVKQPAVPLFNPAELQFFQHFLKAENGEAAPQSFRPKLLSSYTFLSSSLSAMTSSLSSFVNPANNPYIQPYVNSIQSDYRSALNNMPYSGATQTNNGGGTYNATSTAPVPSTTPVVQTNSFMRPQSAKLSNSFTNQLSSSKLTGAAILNGPIVVESKPVSVSDQEREDECKRLLAVKPAVNSSSLPRPPTANAKDRNSSSSQGRANGPSYTNVDDTSAGLGQQTGNQHASGHQRSMSDHSRRVANASPTKVHRSIIAAGSIHRSISFTRAPCSPNPPAITGVAIRSPTSPVRQIEASKLPQGDHIKNRSSLGATKIGQKESLNISPSTESGIISPSVSPTYAKSSTNLTAGNLVPVTNPLLGTFLGHSKVKNLNYTPARPYKDLVSNYGDTQYEYTESQLPARPLPTMFYLKASKPEEMLNDMPRICEERNNRSYDGYEVNGGDPLSDSEEGQSDGEDDPQDPEESENDAETYEEDDDANDDDDDDDEMDGLDEEDGEDSSDDERSVAGSQRSQQSVLHIRSATKRLLGLSISRPTSQSSVKSRPSSSRSRISSASEYQPALTPSVFFNIPPTVNFVTDGHKVEQLPWDLRKLLKWRLSPITPNVVKNCIFRSHFRVTKKNHDWIGYWGKHMKSYVFKTIQQYQKVNHFPGTFQIGRKDRLWRNLFRYQVLHGKQEFNFFPQTFVLPIDLKLLKRAWEEGGSRQKWIIKPPASARGIGIKVINKYTQIPKKQAVIVQRYLSRPYLINDSKFDMRVYVYVTSYDPLRIYVYEDGLARFASVKYSHCMKHVNNKYMHLTNYSINKKNQDYQSNSDENACQGHKWTLKTLWQYMRRRGVDTRKVWESMLDLIVKTVITSEACVNSLVKSNVQRRYSCHELFGFDIMLDETLKPWIIEVNISPSLHSNSPLDIAVKGGMIADLLNIAGFVIPDKRDVLSHSFPKSSDKETSFMGVYIEPRLYPNQLSPDERAKHAYYCQRFKDEHVRATILDLLTPDDIRILTETVNEDSRKGDFIRVFPSPTSHKYHRFFEQPRYYNILLDQWIARYGQMESEGIYMLNVFCKRGIHLENPTNDPRHQWCQPLSHERRAISAPTPPKYGASSNLPSLRKTRLKANGSRSWHGSVVLPTKKKKRKGKIKSVKQREDEPEVEEDSEEN